MHLDEIEKQMPKIIEFCDLGQYFDQPMESYSSGMSARLRFAIASASSPDILLVDEALAVGDATFKDKSRDLVNGILESAGTLLLVSHSPADITKFCQKAVWLEQGYLICVGNAEEVSLKYREWTWHLALGKLDKADELLIDAIDEELL
ncbi:hypothetical protein HMPREF3158_08890 [Corynebacterium sp. HMSC06G04]|nr:hypothetical protein HMPREF3158_08890 [Corynebacterium sp. HMSC06G04]